MVSNRFKTILLAVIDYALYLSALLMVASFRPINLDEHLDVFYSFFLIWLIFNYIEGQYSLRTYNVSSLAISILRSSFLGGLASIIFLYLFPNPIGLTPKTNLILVILVSVPLLYLWKRFFFIYFSKNSLKRTILIGSPETVGLVKEEIKTRPYLGFKVVGINEIPENKKKCVIAIERNYSDNSVYKEVFSLLGKTEVIDLALLAEKISGKIPLNSINESWFVEHCGYSESKSYDFFKNIIDRSVALLLLILNIPIALLIFPLILILHGRPIFFKQKRVGLNNKEFTLYKLRSMVVNAEKNGAEWAQPEDSRVTSFGKLLRKTRVDELPQLINILKGEMSLVGPRPERKEIIEEILKPHIPFYNMRHLVKPGVTGWAQVTFRYGYSQKDSKEKLQYDLYYVKNRTIWLDILVVLKTVKTVMTGAGQ